MSREQCRGALPCAQKTVLHKMMDIHLEDISDLTQRITEIEAEFEQRVAVMRCSYEKELIPLHERMNRAEQQLIADLKQNKSELFRETEKITLPHGIVIHTTEMRLSLPKNAVEAIEKLGWNEAIKIAKSVDRGVVETWPIERIIAIGGDKNPKEKFEYELREDRSQETEVRNL